MFAIRRRHICLLPLLLVALVGCGTQRPETVSGTALTSTPMSVTTPPAVAPPPAPRTQKWIDLAVGECLADPPPSDPTVVTVEVVDCARPHAAEVYARIPVAVNTAIADVANRDCAAGLTDYLGQSAPSSPFGTGYLIDSTQDRTDNNPRPSTVICLLQGVDGGPLTGSARR